MSTVDIDIKPAYNFIRVVDILGRDVPQEPDYDPECVYISVIDPEYCPVCDSKTSSGYEDRPFGHKDFYNTCPNKCFSYEQFEGSLRITIADKEFIINRSLSYFEWVHEYNKMIMYIVGLFGSLLL